MPSTEQGLGDDPVQILALLPYALGCAPSQRYRIEQWSRVLEEQGVALRLSPFLDSATMRILHRPGAHLSKVLGTLSAYRRRVRELLRPPAWDGVFLHREAFLLGPASLERRLLRRFPIVYDFDDAIFLPAPGAANAWAVALKSTKKPAVLCALARHVTVGNEVLGEYARKHAEHVTTLPSTIDTDAYQPVPHSAPRGRLIVGWTGSPSTAQYLAHLREPLLTLRRMMDFQLRVIGAQLAIPGLDVVCQPWAAVSEVQDLSALDVGLMPLPDDPWTQGKCGMKALQYMALSIPAVVSPVGANREIVADGVTGFHARSDAQWVEKIGLLLRSTELRRRLGESARRLVEQRYSARVHAPRLARILKQVASVSRSPADAE